MDGRNDVLPSEDQINADFASHPAADSLRNKEITVSLNFHFLTYKMKNLT